MGVKRAEGLAEVPGPAVLANIVPGFHAAAGQPIAQDILRRRMTLKATLKRFILP